MQSASGANPQGLGDFPASIPGNPVVAHSDTGSPTVVSGDSVAYVSRQFATGVRT